ncbi:HlyD family secretion protein [Amphiplicatus metriothermophilus]|uniref:HlyD family secretion protein n=1 Tax=Amphiplicatus metriothermophilus TaxID=1519374 RepID=A0A239PPI3_9PROT|nr:HlyD family efflux transporter periplasmic adaptor subunit [Amphiplicatus metriothermophilus]MBB5518807.1 HlyD family secretion protein [Amphiplicatus metriothermophilus]SNT72038.1 HlyD family secretion protein [Amphiplicatus metriothermophilus]
MTVRLAYALAAALAASCAQEQPRALSGYVEADYLYMAPQEAGVVSELAVTEGDGVASGDLLFRLDPARMAYAAARAAAAAAAAETRAAESGVLDQAVAEAQAEFARARDAYARAKALHEDGFVSEARLDDERARYEAATARLERALAEREAARREWRSAESEADLARRRLADLAVHAPAAGRIERVYRRVGEVVAAGDPVVALLPPENVKIRFFAPEPMLASFAPGDEVAFSCDGCVAERRARIIFIATQPQFTPPVIYSLKEREKLMFLIEARPLEPQGLRPGLPVDVKAPGHG